MCQSTVYLRDPGAERVLLNVVMKEVASVRPRGDKLVLTSALGEQLEVEGALYEVDLLRHRIVIERRQAPPP